jgi:enoyl-CoA hydratase/carnithine racemase
MEMLLTGEFISATEAQQQGLVNRVVAAEDLTQASRDLAAIISSKAKVAVRTGKAMFYPQLNMDLPQAYQFAAEHMVCNLMTPETQQGLDAFVNKKPKG